MQTLKRTHGRCRWIREGDTGGVIEPRRGETESTIGPRRGDTKGTVGFRERDTEAPSDREDEARGTPPDPEEVVLEVPSGCKEETLEAPSDPEEDKREVPSDHEEEAKDAAGQTELEGLVVPARQKLNISDTLQPNNVKAHVESAGARRRGRNITTKFSANERGRRRRVCVDVRRRGHHHFLEEGGATRADSEEHVTRAVSRQQTMNALEMKEWRKVRKKKCKVAQLNDKLEVAARVIYN